MSKKGKMPELIFVGKIGDPKKKARYKHVLFRVTGKTPEGIPKHFTRIEDNELVNVTDNKVEFMTGYIPEIMTKPPAK